MITRRRDSLTTHMHIIGRHVSATYVCARVRVPPCRTMHKPVGLQYALRAVTFDYSKSKVSHEIRAAFSPAYRIAR